MKEADNSGVRSPRLIAVIKGGLGNQLFAYAAARRLALVNGAELIIDDASGFSADAQYRRQYALDHFHIHGRQATVRERLEPFSTVRRRGLRWLARHRPFALRRYIEQEGVDFDARILKLRFRDCRFLEGYWQSERYFEDIEDIIRNDLRIVPPTDRENRNMAEKIADNTSVAIHIRWFDSPEDRQSPYNISIDYYKRAIEILERRLSAPHYFVFSDNPEAAVAKLPLTKDRMTLVAHNANDGLAHADLWLMKQCQHFIIANSTFSWWGAWLSENREKIVLAPDLTIRKGKAAWGFDGLIPASWELLSSSDERAAA